MCFLSTRRKMPNQTQSDHSLLLSFYTVHWYFFPFLSIFFFPSFSKSHSTGCGTECGLNSLTLETDISQNTHTAPLPSLLRFFICSSGVGDSGRGCRGRLPMGEGTKNEGGNKGNTNMYKMTSYWSEGSIGQWLKKLWLCLEGAASNPWAAEQFQQDP